MKIYSEKQIIEMLDFFQINDRDIQKFLNEMTPIKILNDEEIEQVAPSCGILASNKAFIKGAKWMRNQIIYNKQYEKK